MATRRRPVPIDQSYQKEVKRELKSKRYLSALFLIHNYIEHFMKEHLLLESHFEKEIPKDIKKDVDRIGFYNYLVYYYIGGNLSNSFFKDLKSLNTYRNDLAHGAASIIFFRNIVNQRLIKQKINQGLRFCDKIYNNYYDLLEQKSKELFEQQVEEWIAYQEELSRGK